MGQTGCSPKNLDSPSHTNCSGVVIAVSDVERASFRYQGDIQILGITPPGDGEYPLIRNLKRWCLNGLTAVTPVMPEHGSIVLVSGVLSYLYDFVENRSVALDLTGFLAASPRKSSTCYFPSSHLVVGCRKSWLGFWKLDPLMKENASRVASLATEGLSIASLTCDEEFSPSLVLAGGQMRTREKEGSVRIWDVQKESILMSLSHLEQTLVQAVEWVPFQRHCVVSGATDGVLRFWDTRTPDSDAVIVGNTSVCSLFFPKSRDHLLVVAGEDSLMVCDERNFDQVVSKWDHPNSSLFAVTEIDESRFATSNRGGECKLVIWSYEGTVLHESPLRGPSWDLCYMPRQEDEVKAVGTVPGDASKPTNPIHSLYAIPRGIHGHVKLFALVDPLMNELNKVADLLPIPKDEVAVFDQWLRFDVDETVARAIRSTAYHLVGEGCIVVTFEDAPPKHILSPNAVEVFRDRRLGHGSFGIVCEGVLRVGMVPIQVAVKRGFISSPETLLTAEREVKLMAEVMFHENVVKCYGCYVGGEGRDILHIVMQRCEGGNVIDWLRSRESNGTLRNEDKIACLRQIAEGIFHLHSQPQPLIHRDLKPENILVRKGVVKIVDFGLSKHAGSVSDINAGGTIGYLPNPEHVVHETEAGKIDAYAFGIIAWEIWTLKRAYEEERSSGVVRLSLMLKIQQGLRPDLSVCLNMPDALKELCVECWSDQPGNRPMFADVVERVRRM